MWKFKVIIVILIASNFLGLELMAQYSKTKSNNPIYSVEEDDAPFSVYYLGLGISGSLFAANSATWKNISFSTNPNDHVIGGSFDGMESAVRMSLTTNISRDSKWLLPISYEYLFMRANELIYYNLTPQINYFGTFHHEIDVQKFSIGVDWQALQTPFGDVKFYVGLDAKAFYISNQKFVREDIRMFNDTTVEINKFPYTPKANTFRFGLEPKFGFRGHIINNFYINSFIGYEMFNLIGRDDARGQLFTPFRNNENKEDIVNAFHYYLSVEYKL